MTDREKLLLLMGVAGVTQQRVASEAGCSRSYVNGMVCGQRRVTDRVLVSAELVVRWVMVECKHALRELAREG